MNHSTPSHSPELSGPQKREYLRLLLSEGKEAADNFLKAQERPTQMIFSSHEELVNYYDEFERRTGLKYRYWGIIVPPIEETI